MFISSNTPPPAKRCRRALMKLFGLAETVAKELRLSCFFFFPFFSSSSFGLQIGVIKPWSGDKHTSRCSRPREGACPALALAGGLMRLETRPCCEGVYHQPTSSHLALRLISCQTSDQVFPGLTLGLISHSGTDSDPASQHRAPQQTERRVNLLSCDLDHFVTLTHDLHEHQPHRGSRIAQTYGLHSSQIH